MAEVTPEQQRFQQAALLPGPALSSFFSSQPSDLLPNCQGGWPDFFNHNLVSPYRVLKILKDSPHSNIRAFYYQLLRVTYEVETEQGFNRSFMYNLITVVFNEGFEVFFDTDTDNQRDLFNDQTFKKLFAEFVNLLEADGIPQVERTLNSYPIMDIVFVHIFRSILASQDINFPFNAKIPTEAVIGELSGLLGLSVEAFGNNCWKFDDSDMFCYEDNDNELYLAFIIDAGVVTSEEASGEPSGRQEYLNNQIDSATTQTIQLYSLSDRDRPSDGLSSHYNAPVDLGYSSSNYSAINTPGLGTAYTYESRVEDLTYKPSLTLGLTSYDNQLSSSLVQTSFQASSYQDPLYKSSAGAFNLYEPVTRPIGSAFSNTFELNKPSSAYPSFDYSPKYETPAIAVTADFGGARYSNDLGGSYAGATSSLTSNLPMGTGADYNGDFTSDRLLEKLEEPYRSKVAQIKSRVRGWRRSELPSSFGISSAGGFNSSFSVTANRQVFI